jgi:hypothetical protein
MNQIQKELSQLEHWLIHLPEEAPTHAPVPHAPSPVPVREPESFPSSEWSRLLSSVEQLTKQMEIQQTTLHHIIGRISILESVKEVHIESDHEDPWMDNETSPFVPDETEEQEDDMVYIVHKSSSSSPSSPREAVQGVVEQEEVVEVIQQEVVQQEEVVEVIQQEVIQQEQVQQEAIVEAVQEQVQQEAVQEQVQQEAVVEAVQEQVQQEVVVEAVQEQVQQEAVQEQVQQDVQEVEEEEEEEGIELEELTYQGVVYYRDPELFVYSVEENGEVSEEPIGYWREKTKTIAFYNKK